MRIMVCQPCCEGNHLSCFIKDGHECDCTVDSCRGRSPLDKKHDPVNHPSHYTRGKIEVIDFIEDQQLGYHRGQVIKYACRAGFKDPNTLIEDLKKARWYLDREINKLCAQNTLTPGT